MLRRIIVLVVLLMLFTSAVPATARQVQETDQASGMSPWAVFLDWFYSLTKGGSTPDPDGLIAPGDGGSMPDPNGFVGGPQTQTTGSDTNSDVGAQSDPSG